MPSHRKLFLTTLYNNLSFSTRDLKLWKRFKMSICNRGWGIKNGDRYYRENNKCSKVQRIYRYVTYYMIRMTWHPEGSMSMIEQVSKSVSKGKNLNASRSKTYQCAARNKNKNWNCISNYNGRPLKSTMRKGKTTT